jgi:hypothetical protein
MTGTDSKRRARDQIIAIVAAHGGLTEAVARAAQVLNADGRGEFATHLDHHRAELNVAVGELALWAESFGHWARVDIAGAIHRSATGQPQSRVNESRYGVDLLVARERLKSRRAEVLAELRNARSWLRGAGLPVEEITTYRRTVRLWAGEAIDVVSAVHRLTLADAYIRAFGQLGADVGKSIALVRQWMNDLEEADREGELVLAESCGYGHVVQDYRRWEHPRVTRRASLHRGATEDM